MAIIKDSTKAILYSTIRPFALPITIHSLLLISEAVLSLYPIQKIKEVINLLANSQPQNIIYKVIFIYICLRVFFVIISVANRFLSSWISSIIEKNIRINITNQVVSNYLKLNKLNSTELVTRIFDISIEFVSGLMGALSWLSKSLISLSLIFYYIFTINKSTSLFLLPSVLLMVIVTQFSSKIREKYYLKEAEKGAYNRNIIQEIIQNLKPIFFFNAGSWAMSKYKKSEEEYLLAKVRFKFSLGFLMWVLSSIGILVNSLILILATRQNGSTAISIGDITAYLLYIGSLFGIVMDMCEQFSSFSRIKGAFKRFDEIFSSENTEKQLDIIKEKINQIKITNLSYSYDKEILIDINLTINYGENIALVGKSGVGKTTLINLIHHRLVAESGNILLNNHNINDISAESIKYHIASVDQDISLFDDTIQNNILLGTRYDHDHYKKIISGLCIDEFMKKNNFNDNTVIEEHGSKISGGEKQRIGIARALYRSQSFLLLDEPTKGLDSYTKRKVLETITLSEKTLIISTHDKDVFEHVDKIAILNDGKIIAFDDKDVIKNNFDLEKVFLK